MSSALPLRTDFSSDELRRLAGRSKDAKQARRLLSMAAICDGMDRGSAAKAGGMDRQSLRDWVIRFNELGPDGLFDKKAPGGQRRLSDAQLEEFAAIVDAGPDPLLDGVVRWRCCDLVVVLKERFGVVYKERAVANLLKLLGFSRISGRPQHPAQDPQAIEAFKKTSKPRWQRI